MRGWLAYLARARSVREQIDAYRLLSVHLNRYRSILVVEFDERAAVEFQRLRKLHPRIGSMDLKIAAIVLVRGDVLLSRNMSDFGRIAGLKVEDWSSVTA